MVLKQLRIELPEPEPQEPLLEILQSIKNSIDNNARFTARDLTGKDILIITKSGNRYVGDVFVQEASGLWINCRDARDLESEKMLGDATREVFIPREAIESVSFTRS